MALITDATLTNNANSKQYLFRAVHQFKWKRDQPSIGLPIVNASPQNNVLFRFSGQVDSFNFRFAIVNDGTDTAGGTHTSTVETIAEQIAYLKDYIYTEDFDTDWNISTSEFAPGAGEDGVIDSLDIDAEGGSPNIRFATFAFKRGRIGSL